MNSTVGSVAQNTTESECGLDKNKTNGQFNQGMFLLVIIFLYFFVTKLLHSSLESSEFFLNRASDR